MNRPIILNFILIGNLIFLIQLSAFHLITKSFAYINFLIITIKFLKFLFPCFFIINFIKEMHHFNSASPLFFMFPIKLNLI